MLTSLQNQTVKQLRKLQQPKERKKQAVLLLEGTNLVEAACDVRYPLQTLCFTEAWRSRYQTLSEQAIALSSQVELVSPEVLSAIASTVTPDGVVAIAPRRNVWEAESGRPKDSVSLGVVLETLQDPGNLGTIIRTAAGAGSDGLWLSHDSVDLSHPKVLRASVGQWFRMPMATVNAVKQAKTLREQGLQVVATAATAELNYWQLDLRQPTVFLMGNEGAGLSPEIMASASVSVKIPVMPTVESLNVAVSTALLLYEAKRQRAS
ncbi:RNA methyltransferase [cf. Phormidesmis sp. LEGE 11477]|uniref:TrmH family RNA methyltransferase n=1 Tax=cf. Phormidesmis sp. LEGE 11477 TaxID=1828680 RepID=UPI001882C308|nr:RNA methyltransferase [cf. Phormidesmis sp. LEGE 11477]MBE9060543.1 RNA methyltransferase [cf. Phormidesmis sp. LEGE 11477]